MNVCVCMYICPLYGTITVLMCNGVREAAKIKKILNTVPLKGGGVMGLTLRFFF